MNFDEIYGTLARVQAIVGEWRSSGAVGAVERDMVLEKLRKVYEDIRFADSALLPENQVDVPAEAFTEELAGETVPQADMGAEESAGDDSSVDDAPTPVLEVAGGGDRPEVVDVPFAEPSLFDLSEVTVSHSVDRRAILSLYGDDEPDAGNDELPVPDAIDIDIPDDISVEVVEQAAECPPAQAEDVAEPEEKGYRLENEQGKAPDHQATAKVSDDVKKSRAGKQSRKVLGEVMNNGGAVLGESVSYAAGRTDVASKIASGNTVGLRRNIGVNDKYLIMRDLFAGDTGQYEAAMTALDGCGDLPAALIHIHDNYEWDPDSEGAKLLVELLTRKFS